MHSKHASLMALALCGLLACASDDTAFGGAGSASGGNAVSSGTTTNSGGAGGTTTSAGGSTTSSGGAGGAGGGGVPCRPGGDNNPCADGEYCNAPDCMNGFCEPRPMMQDTIKDPVCGCDNVNYWNATTAAQHGMSVESMGLCTTPETCGRSGGSTMPKACPNMRLQCGEFVGSAQQCMLSNGSPRGVCWGMPESCPMPDNGPQYRSCNPNQLTCVGECQAIKSDGTFYEDMQCP